MKFSIVGTGNMAWFLAHRLTMSGHRCVGIYGRDQQRAGELAASVNGTSVQEIEDIADLEQEVTLLAVTDLAIAELAGRLSKGRAVLVHTSGATDLSVLEPAQNHGVIWPVYSIVKHQLPNHRQVPCAIDANNPQAMNIVRQLAHGFSEQVFEADDLQRRWLHLGAVIGNNFVNHLLAICESICTERSLPFSVLMPIISQTFERIHQQSPAKLQTGPAIRRDLVTIDRHLDLLASHPQLAEIYRSMTDSIQNSDLHDSTGNPVKD